MTTDAGEPGYVLAADVEEQIDTQLTASVQNVTDRDPPFARLDLNYDPFTGNPLGRVYKVGLRQKF
mgnify:CR=1 FL=1